MLDCKRLKKCREDSFMTQDYVARYLNINLRTYKYYEAGQRQPSLAQLIALADFFCVSIDYLTGRYDLPEYERYVERAYRKELGGAPVEVRNFYNSNILGKDLAGYRAVMEFAKDMWMSKSDDVDGQKLFENRSIRRK